MKKNSDLLVEFSSQYVNYSKNNTAIILFLFLPRCKRLHRRPKPSLFARATADILAQSFSLVRRARHVVTLWFKRSAARFVLGCPSHRLAVSAKAVFPKA